MLNLIKITNMKYIKLIGVLVAGIFVFFSCDIDLAPIDYYGSGNYWENVTQAETYVTGLHTGLRGGAFTQSFLLGEARGGSSKSGTSSLQTSLNYDRIKENNIDKDNTGITNWAGLYGSIFACNLFIQNIEDSDLYKREKAQLDYLLGQVYGLRAYYYFSLYKTFGGVPIIERVKVLDGQVKAEDLYTKRSTPKEVMTFIKSDIEKSLKYFGNNETMKGNRSYWAKATTLTLAGGVYLWSAKVTTGDQTPTTEDLKKAKNYLMTIYQDSRFGLVDDFSKIFDVKNKGNKEFITAIRFADGEATNSAGEFVYADPNGYFINTVYGRDGKLIPGDTLQLKGSGWQRNEYELNLWKSFDAADSRRDATFLEYYEKDGTLKGTVLRKNLGEINSSNRRVFSGDEAIYRYADVVLMLAEVANMEGGDVAPYINQIRERAYGSNWDKARYGYVNADFKTNEIAILRERDKEFVNEGKRWYDIVRMKDAPNGQPLAFMPGISYKGENIPVLQKNEAHKLLWPININVLNADPELTQTPGY